MSQLNDHAFRAARLMVNRETVPNYVAGMSHVSQLHDGNGAVDNFVWGSSTRADWTDQ